MFVIRRNNIIVITLLDLIIYIIQFDKNQSRLVVISYQDDYTRFSFKEFPVVLEMDFSKLITIIKFCWFITFLSKIILRNKNL